MYLLISLVPPIADIDGPSCRISQSELSQRFTPRFSWRRKCNQEWQVMAAWCWLDAMIYMSLYHSLTILSVSKRHFYIGLIRTTSCVTFGCNNTAIAAQLKLSDAAHARLTAETCISLPSATYPWRHVFGADTVSSNLFCALSIIIFFTRSDQLHPFKHLN